MKKRASSDELFEAPTSPEYIELATDPLVAFKHYQAVNYGEKGGLVSLGDAVWDSQKSLDLHIRSIMALNLVLSIKNFKTTADGKARTYLGMPRNAYTIARQVESLVTQGVNLRKACAELRAMFPVEKITVDPVKIIAGKARRVGTTAWLLGLDLHTTMFTPNTEVAIVAHDEKSVQNIFRSLKRYYQLWPKRLDAWRPAEYANSRTLLEFNNGSKLATYTAGGQDIRSFQLDIVHLSEYAHYTDLSAVTSMLTAIPPHCWVFKESTANGRQGPFYEDWLKARTVEEVIQAWDNEDAQFFMEWNGLYKWFFSWLDDPRYQLPVQKWEKFALESSLDNYETALRQRFPKKFTLERIKWRRQKLLSGECQDASLPPEQFFAQEYPADEDEMFQVTGSMPFPSEKLDPMDQRAKAAVPLLALQISSFEMPKVVKHNQANFIVWHPPAKEQLYTVGCDVSQGIGKRGDASYIAVLRRVDGFMKQQVAGFWSKTTDARELGHILAQVARWYNDAFVVVEANGPGQLTAITLYEDNRYFNVFHRPRLTTVSADSGESFTIGFDTKSASKAALIEDLIYHFRQGLIEICDPKTIAEMRTFKRDDKGRFEAAEGANDDRVIAIALASFGDNPLRGAPPLNRATIRPSHKAPEDEPTIAPRDRYTRAYLEAVARIKKKADDRLKRPTKTWYQP